MISFKRFLIDWTHLQIAHFFIFPLTGSMNLLCGIWHREHPDGNCAAAMSESVLSIIFCNPILTFLKSFAMSRSLSFGVTDTIGANCGFVPSLIVNCALMTAAVPIADKTHTSSLKSIK